MKHAIDNPQDKFLIKNIRRLMEERGFRYKKHLSFAAGLGETYVTDLFAGRVQSPTMDKLKKLADALHVTIEELTESPGNGGKVKGRIIQGGIVVLTEEMTADAPSLLQEGEYEFSDNSNAPMAWKGWRYRIGKRQAAPSEYNYSPYMVKVKGGGILVRRIMQDSQPNRYILINPANTETMENVEIEYCAKVENIIPV